MSGVIEQAGEQPIWNFYEYTCDIPTYPEKVDETSKKEEATSEKKEEGSSLDWNNFTRSTTFHGVRYIFDPAPSKLRRCLWIGCVLLAIGLFLVQVFSRTVDYLDYKSNVNVAKIYPKDMIPFPAVTICNQNNYRMTHTIAFGLYEFIDHAYSTTNLSSVQLDDFPWQSVPIDYFVRSTAHQKEDLIDSCQWDGEPCDMEDFKMVFTDLGVCYTFNSNPERPPLMVKESGKKFGLSLVMNVEQYEYMRGPQNDAGISILLHNQSEIPQMKDLGFSVAPGAHTTIGIKRIEVSNLESPYGTCKLDTPPTSVCMADCRMKKVLDTCKCLIMSSSNLTQTRTNNDTEMMEFCKWDDQFKCVLTNNEILSTELDQCNCSIPCERIQYEPSLSYAQLSKFNIERIVLTDRKKKEEVRQKFIYAREKSQAYFTEIVEVDKQQTDTLISALTKLVDMLDKYKDILVAASEIAEKHGTIDVLNDGVDILNTDLDMYGLFYVDRLYVIHYKIVLEWEVNFYQNTVELPMNPFINKTWPKVNETGIFLKDEFLEINGTTKKSLLYETLISCYDLIENVSEPFNFNISSSSKDDSTLDQNDTRCLETLKRKIDQAKSWADFDVDTLPEDLQIYYDAIVDFVFTNTSKDVSTEFPQHNYCMDALLDFQLKNHKQKIENIQNLTFSWIETLEAGSINITIELTEILVEDVQSKKYEDIFKMLAKIQGNCQWMKNYTSFYYCDYTDCTKTQEVEFEKRMNLGIRDSMREKFSSLQTSYANILRIKNRMRTIATTRLKPLVANLTSFLKQGLTKTEIAELFESRYITKGLDELSSLAMELDRFGLEYNDQIEIVEKGFKKNYDGYFNFSLPWVNTQVLENFKLIQILRQHENATKLNKKIKGLLRDTKEDIQGNLMMIITALFDPWRPLVSYPRLEFSKVIENEIADSVAVFKENLKQFIDGNKMDDKFFLENFMQVDIYYRELSYEKIEQQISFKLLSLFSEVGGFLGLLLGASVLTVCELVDYLAIVCTTRMAKQGNVSG